MDEPVNYAAAEAELQEILEALESEAVDVDELSGHVQRAKALITWCREQVTQAEVTITELLEEAPGDTAPDDRPPDEDASDGAPRGGG